MEGCKNAPRGFHQVLQNLSGSPEDGLRGSPGPGRGPIALPGPDGTVGPRSGVMARSGPDQGLSTPTVRWVPGRSARILGGCCWGIA